MSRNDVALQPEDARLAKRQSFDEVASLYAAARPGYPEVLVRDIAFASGDAGTKRVLEIGPGTGQLTLPLAKLGFSIVAVELGPRLAALLESVLAPFSNASVVVADFDEWSPELRSFDLVVAATAFHWLDPRTRTAKCASLLRPGGTLIVVDTHWGAGRRQDRFALESQQCYARWVPGHDPTYRPPGPEDLPDANEELEKSGLFAHVRHKHYLCDLAFDAHEYCRLLGTFSDIRSLNDRSRNGLVACIAELIERRFVGRVVRRNVYDLWIARTSE